MCLNSQFNSRVLAIISDSSFSLFYLRGGGVGVVGHTTDEMRDPMSYLISKLMRF